MVMGLVGPSLEDIRREILYRDFSKPTAMNASLQTLQAIWDLHDVGYLHRWVARVNLESLMTDFVVGISNRRTMPLDLASTRRLYTCLISESQENIVSEIRSKSSRSNLCDISTESDVLQ